MKSHDRCCGEGLEEKSRDAEFTSERTSPPLSTALSNTRWVLKTPMSLCGRLAIGPLGQPSPDRGGV